MTVQKPGDIRGAMANKQPFLPCYASSIKDARDRKRYQDKVSLLRSLDPYETLPSMWSDDLDGWPEVTDVGVTMHLLFAPSPCSKDELKNYKSMDSYQRFVAGFVRDVLTMVRGPYVIVIGKVQMIGAGSTVLRWVKSVL